LILSFFYYIITPMDILREIQQIIENITKDGAAIDISHIRNILVESYEVVRDGLQRSHYADEYVNIKSQFDSLQTANATISSELELMRLEFEKLKPQVTQYSALFLDLKQKLTGKLQLLKSFSPEYKLVLSEQIDNSTPDSFLQLKTLVENTFSSEWSNCKSADSLKSLPNANNFLNFKQFKSGR